MNKKINFGPVPGRRSGFTLIEILIVVAIIAILASVVLVGLGPTQRIGRDARRLADLRNVQTALELYYNRCGYYPGAAITVAAGTPCSARSGAPANWDAFEAVLLGSTALGLSTNIPNDPSSPGRVYDYAANTDGSAYVLRAKLEDPNNPALRDDLDLTTFSLTCSDAPDPFYCITL